MKRVQDMSPTEILGLAVAVGLVAGATWLGVLAGAWRLLDLGRVPDEAWSFVEGVSSAAVLATVLGGGMVVLVQLVELVEGRKRETASANLQAYGAIFDLMMSDESIDARRFVYQELPADPEQGLATLDEEGRRRVKLVLNSLDYLGLLVEQDVLTGKAIVDWASPFVAKAWARLGPYVAHEAGRRNEPDYYRAARDLGERCLEARRRLVGTAAPTWVEGSL